MNQMNPIQTITCYFLLIRTKATNSGNVFPTVMK